MGPVWSSLSLWNLPYGLPLRLSVKEPACNAADARDAGSIPGLGRSPGGGNCNPRFLPGESHGQSLACCSPHGRKEWDTPE